MKKYEGIPPELLTKLLNLISRSDLTIDEKIEQVIEHRSYLSLPQVAALFGKSKSWLAGRRSKILKNKKRIIK